MGFAFTRFYQAAVVDCLLDRNPGMWVGGRVLRLEHAWRPGSITEKFLEHNNGKMPLGYRGDRSVPVSNGVSSGSQAIPWSFKKALVGREPYTYPAQLRRLSIKFSYVKASTKEWLSCIIVGRLISVVDLGQLQREVSDTGMSFTVVLVDDIYCLITFLSVETRYLVLKSKSTWFAKRSITISRCEVSDLANCSISWVRLWGVLLLLWNTQFFVFIGMELGRLLEIALSTIARENLSEAWVKLEISNRSAIPTKLEVESSASQ